MSKSRLFRIAAIALIWIVMAKAGFGILLTLIAVFAVFLTINTVLLMFRIGGRTAGMFIRR
ncbi:MAG: hypothetical protein H9W81_07945 [Enterococcus sp.]|nr:hypothetical protein [Enterococcus sp.]